jgi:hypothetical protein
VIEVFGPEGCFGFVEFLKRHLSECHGEDCSMDPEEFFPDPFEKGGWFLFQTPERLLPWRTVHITREIEPSSLHFSKLKALRYIEKEIQKYLAEEAHEPITILTHDLTPDSTQRTLARLTYDWAPLNKALEEAK